MPWWSGILFLAIVCLNNGVTNSQDLLQPYNYVTENRGQDFNKNSKNNNQAPDPKNDIQFDYEPMELLSAGGSGHGGFPSDDEDLYVSGSGSGSGFGSMEEELDSLTPTTAITTRSTTSTTTTAAPVPSRPLSDCERSRKHNKMVGKSVPTCLANGDYAPMQCMNLPYMSECWCVDMTSQEIHGTRMEAPNMPNCETGENLSPCVFSLVMAHRHQLLGSFRPQCNVDGQYERTQCQGSFCYCVDPLTGQKEFGTEVPVPDRPDCRDEESEDSEDTFDIGGEGGDESEEDIVPVTQRPAYEKPKGDKTGGETDPQIVFPDSEGPDGENVNIDGEKEDKEDKEKTLKDPNKTGVADQGEIGKQGDEDKKSSVEKAGEIMTQPGILAGIIGGGVVLLLCLVLLVMFIVYRMRKKDEGSYPLDEPRRPANYSYVRTPDKEFYA